MIRLYKNYCQALAETIIEKPGQSNGSHAELKAARDNIEAVLTQIRDHAELRQILTSPVISKKEKAKVVLSICEKLSVSQEVKNMFLVLAQKNRFQRIEAFLEVFDSVKAELEGTLIGTIESAHGLSESDVAELAGAFEKKFSKKVHFSVSTDPALLGGMRVTVNGVTYDRSLQTQVRKFRESVVDALK